MDFEEKQKLNREELRQFREEIATELCAVCDDKAYGFTRTKHLCRKHYKKLIEDNKKRHENGVDIDDSVLTLK